MTESRIKNIAEHYVSKYECSQGMLRGVLERRLQKRLLQLDSATAAEERAKAEPMIEAEVARLVKAGVVDDQRFAEMKTRGWLNSGRGARRIAQDLSLKGIDRDTIQDALAAASRELTGMHDEDVAADDAVESAEWEAAEAFARKKRIGQHRRTAMPEDYKERAKVWRREAAAMSRAGFDLDIIRQILDREPDEPDC